MGFTYRRLVPRDKVVAANVRWLAGYRHLRHRDAPYRRPRSRPPRGPSSANSAAPPSGPWNTPRRPGYCPQRLSTARPLTGARTESGRVFLVGAVAHAGGVVLGQTQVPDKRGEGEAARSLLTQLALPGWVFTLDALHTTKKTARLITDRLDAHYVLILKGNQPLARAAAQRC